MDKIAKLLYDYSVTSSLFSADAFLEIIDTILAHNNLQGKVFYKIVKEQVPYTELAEFDMKNLISFYAWAIYLCICKRKYLNQYDTRLTREEDTCKKNNLLIETALHEVKHAKELMQLKDTNDHSFEAELYRYEYAFEFANGDQRRHHIYQTLYPNSFMERQANIESFEQDSFILSMLGPRFHRIYESEVKMTADYMLKDYHHNLTGPTISFIKNIGCFDALTRYDEQIKSMSFEERFRYGLPITSEEYKQKIKK